MAAMGAPQNADARLQRSVTAINGAFAVLQGKMSSHTLTNKILCRCFLAWQLNLHIPCVLPSLFIATHICLVQPPWKSQDQNIPLFSHRFSCTVCNTMETRGYPIAHTRTC